MASIFSPVNALTSMKLDLYSLAKALASSPFTSLLGKSYLLPTNIILMALSEHASNSLNHFLANKNDSFFVTSNTITAPSEPR